MRLRSPNFTVQHTLLNLQGELPIISLFPPGGLSRILSTLGFPCSSSGMVHRDVRLVALKKNVRSSLLHTTDQGVAGTGMLEIGRGPFGSDLTGMGIGSASMEGGGSEGGNIGGNSIGIVGGSMELKSAIWIGIGTCVGAAVTDILTTGTASYCEDSVEPRPEP